MKVLEIRVMKNIHKTTEKIKDKVTEYHLRKLPRGFMKPCQRNKTETEKTAEKHEKLIKMILLITASW